jgi:hypothetical protein
MRYPAIIYVAACLTGLIPQTVKAATPPMTFSKFEVSKAGLLPQLKKRFGEKARYSDEEVLAVETSKPIYFRADEIKIHFGVIAKLDPTKAHLYEQLITRFGKKATYSADEVTAIEVPEVPGRKPSTGSPTSAADTFSAAVVQQHFAMLHSSNPKSKASMAALRKKYPAQTSYTAAQLRDVEENGEKTVQTIPRPETPITFVAEKEAEMKQPVFLKGWKTPLVRHDWTDVLITEDPSLSENAVKSKIDDLVGATFSYAHNGKANTDTWTTVGSLIFPWVYDQPVERSLFPPHIAIAPSVSINRISTSGASTGEVDQLLFRIGLYAEWFEPFWHLMDLLQLRAAPVYGTNTGFEARMPGAEADIEPSWLFNNSEGNECKFKIGYRNTLLPKEPLLKDSSDQSNLDYQLRVWLHVEGGDIQDIGTSFAPVRGSFFRLGPTAQLRINFPTFYKGFSVTAQYSYLPTIEGPTEHESLFSVNATLAILADKAQHQKVSLNASYTKGGLNFTKQDVDTFTLGLSALF